MDQILRAFLSADNEKRRAAEEEIYAMQMGPRVDELAASLVQGIRKAPEPELRQTAAVVMRKALGHQEVWNRMKPETRKRALAELLAALQQERTRPVQTAICDTVAELAVVVIDNKVHTEGWPELLPFMHAAIGAPAPEAQEVGFMLFERLAGYVADEESHRLPHLCELLHSRMSGDSVPPALRRAATAAAVGFILQFHTDKSRRNLIPLLTSLYNQLLAAVAAKSEDSVRFGSMLVQLAEFGSDMFLPALAEVVTKCTAIAGDRSVNSVTRRYCMEVVVTLAEGQAVACRKLPGGLFLTTVMPVLMRLGCEWGNPPHDWMQQWERAHDNDDELNEDDDDNFVQFAELSIQRIGLAIRAKKFLPALKSCVMALVTSTDPAAPPMWTRKHLAGSVLAAASELFDDPGEFPALMTQLEHLLADPMPLVRYNAVNAAGALCMEQLPEFQDTMHQRLAPFFLRALKDSSRRVRMMAAAGLSFYMRPLDCDVNPECMKPYLKEMVQGLMSLVTSDDVHAQVDGLATLDVVAVSAKSLVGELYPLLYGGLHRLIAAPDMPVPHDATQERREESKMLRHRKSKAMNCLVSYGIAAGREVLVKDVDTILQGMLGMVDAIDRDQAALAEAKRLETEGGNTAAASGAAAAAAPTVVATTDDPIISHIWDCWGRIAQCVGEKPFAPYLDRMMKRLLAAASVNVKGQTVAVEDDDSDAAEDEDHVDFNAGEGLKVRFNNSEVDDKMCALNSVHAFFDAFKGRTMAPYALAAVNMLLSTMNGEARLFDEMQVDVVKAFPSVFEALVATVPLAEAEAAAAAGFNLPPPPPSKKEEDASSSSTTTTTGGTKPAPAPVAPEPLALPPLPAPPAPTTPAQHFLALLTRCIVSMCALMQEEDMVEVKREIVTAVHDLLRDSCDRTHFHGEPDDLPDASRWRPMLHPAVVEHIVGHCVQLRQEIVQRRSTNAADAATAGDELDEEAREAMEEGEEEDRRLAQMITELICMLVKTHPASLWPVYCVKLADKVSLWSHPACAPPDQLTAVFIIDEILQYIGDRAVDTRPPNPDPRMYPADGRAIPLNGHWGAGYLAYLIRATKSKESNVQLAAVWGLGAAAQACRDIYTPFAPAALAALGDVIRTTSTRCADGVDTVHDTAVSAIVKLLDRVYSHPPIAAALAAVDQPRSKVMHACLSRMPLTADPVEQVSTVKAVCNWIRSGDPDALGITAPGTPPQPTRVAGLLNIVAATAAHKLQRLTRDEMSDLVRPLLSWLQANLPKELLGAVWGALMPAARDVLGQISSGNWKTMLEGVPAPVPVPGAGAPAAAAASPPTPGSPAAR